MFNQFKFLVMTTQKFMSQNYEKKIKMNAINSKDFKKACEAIKNWQIEKCLDDESFVILENDSQNRTWYAGIHKGTYHIFIEEERAFPLGKLQQYLFDFIEQKEHEEAEENDYRGYQRHQDFLFANFGYGKI